MGKLINIGGDFQMRKLFQKTAVFTFLGLGVFALPFGGVDVDAKEAKDKPSKAAMQHIKQGTKMSSVKGGFKDGEYAYQAGCHITAKLNNTTYDKVCSS